jgi:hypothetical protein
MRAKVLGLSAVITLGLAGCGGGGSSLESRLSAKSKLEITDCKKTDDIGIGRIPNTQAWVCKYKDTVTGERHRYLALTDSKGNPVEGLPDPLDS